MLEREAVLDAFLKSARLNDRERAFVDAAVRRVARRYEMPSWGRWAACVILTLALGSSILKEERRTEVSRPSTLAAFSVEYYGPDEAEWISVSPASVFGGFSIDEVVLRVSDSFSDSLVAFSLMEDAARAQASGHRMAALALFEMAASYELPAVDPWRPRLLARIETLRS
jgi:hypothetical protein